MTHQYDKWDDLRDRAWCPLDLLRVLAEEYIAMGKVFWFWESINGPSAEALSEYHFNHYRESLNGLKSHCDMVGLETSAKLVAKTLAVLASSVSYETARAKMGELSRCVDAEISSRFFFFVPAHRAKYLVLYGGEVSQTVDAELTTLGSEIIRFQPALKKFPDAVFDLEEAGNCFATGNFTACVFHLMRVCEHGLVSLAKSLGIDPGIADWQKILKVLTAKIGELDSTHPPEWIADREFYAESAALMYNVKNAWRNSVSHVRRSYDEARSLRIFNAVEALMAHLASRLREEQLPRTSLLTDPEAAG